MKDNDNISIIKWNPLPAPADRFLLVRFHDLDEPAEWASELAYSVDGVAFLGDNDLPFYADVIDWAYLPYDQ